MEDLNKTPAIIIDGVTYEPTPDPDARRKRTAPDKPIVEYCNTKYYLLNSAKLQMVNDLNCFVGISQVVGKQLLLGSQNKDGETKTKLEEQVRETTWNLCKKYFGLFPHLKREVHYINYVSTEIEKKFGAETENSYREEAKDEIKIFITTYVQI